MSNPLETLSAYTWMEWAVLAAEHERRCVAVTRGGRGHQCCRRAAYLFRLESAEPRALCGNHARLARREYGTIEAIAFADGTPFPERGS